MRKIFKFKSFWAVFVLAVIIFGVVFLDADKKYRLRTEILVLPQNEISAINFPYVMENLQFFAHGKKSKNTEIEARTAGKSGVLFITVEGENAFQTQILSRKTTQKFLNETALYYDIKKELALEILATNSLPQNFSRLILSILKGLVWAFGLSFFSFYFSFFIFKKETDEENMPADIFSWDKKISADAPSLEAEFWLPKKKKAGGISEEKEKKLSVSYALRKTASAPDNLPIAPEAVMTEKEESFPAASEKTFLIKEATPEEVKERLNKLLSGKLS